MSNEIIISILTIFTWYFLWHIIDSIFDNLLISSENKLFILICGFIVSSGLLYILNNKLLE